MQPTDARKSFPCFDEPALKAYFDITLLHEEETIALSNGKEIGQFEALTGGQPFSLKDRLFSGCSRKLLEKTKIMSITEFKVLLFKKN